jgi:hypothetical protein
MHVYPQTSNANSDSHAGLAKCAKKNGTTKVLFGKLRSAANLTETAIPAASGDFTRQYSRAEPLVPDGSTDNDTNNSGNGSEFHHRSSIRATQERPAAMKSQAAAQRRQKTSPLLAMHIQSVPAAGHRHMDTPASAPVMVPPQETPQMTHMGSAVLADGNHSHPRPTAALPIRCSSPESLPDQKPSNT